MSTIFFNKQRNEPIDDSSSGDNTIIPAPTSPAYIAIDHVNILPTSAVTVKFQSATTELTGHYPLDAKQAPTPENPSDWEDGRMQTAAGEAFVMNLSAAVQVGGYVRYRIKNE